MKQYYKDNGQRRYYIAKRITTKKNKENFIKALLQMGAMWLIFFTALFLFFHLID
jgi:hypothetical protein|tara:strand:+ start:468 stop:632 length:165 start_codon:yes stop_codon:yes gene_type:complete